MTEPRSLPSDDDEALIHLSATRESGGDVEVERLLDTITTERRAILRERLAALERVRGVFARLPLPVEAEPVFKGFRIERRIGEGALGVVYAAFDETLEREVALKVLRRGTSERVLAEARRAAGLADPSIVTVHSIAEGGGRTAIVMECVDGHPIDQVADALTYAQKARLLHGVARGLAAAHARGVVHRDLKPANVLVTPSLRPRILDFGLAVREGTPSFGAFHGTPLYASPEQARGEPARAASDVFALGSLMYRVLVGVPPFRGDDAIEVLRRIESEDPPYPSGGRDDVPRGLQAICLAAMARDPDERPSAEEIADDLGRYLAGDEVRLRPVLYRDRLRRGIAEQMCAVDEWERQGMIAAIEGDRLRAVFRRVLADEDHWILDVRRLSPPQTILNAAVWLTVVSVALLVWLGRDALGPTLRFAIPLSGFVLLLVFGGLLQLRRQVETAAVLLAGAVLCALPAVLATVSELAILAERPDGAGQLLPEPYSNHQVLVACAAAAALSIVAFAGLRYTALAWTTADLLVLTWIAWRITRGWLDAAPEIRALECLPLLAFVIPGLWFERVGRVRWAFPFHAVALITLVIGLDVIAEHGTTLRMLGLFIELDEGRSESFSIALNGLLFIALMVRFERSASLDLRRGARVLEWLAPLHLLGALFANALVKDGPGVDVVLYLVAVLFLLAMGPWRSHRRLFQSGLLGLALGTHLLIHREWFEPVPFLVILGASGLVIAFSTWRWMGRRPD